MIPVTRKEFQDLLDRLGALEEQLATRFSLGRENDELRQELRTVERDLAAKTAEVERLRNELLLQKHAWEKEVESRRKAFEEKESLLRQEATDRLGMAQEFHDRQVRLEKERYFERSYRERERVDRELEDLHRDEGFWARVMRLLTWS